MTEYDVKHSLKRPPSHPGMLMREILAEHARLPIAVAAARMQITRQSLYAVLNGDSALTADMALRFARLTGGNPALYLQMQLQRDLWEAGQRLARTLEEIEPAA